MLRPFRLITSRLDVSSPSNSRCSFSTTAARRMLVCTAAPPFYSVNINRRSLFGLPIRIRSKNALPVSHRVNFSYSSRKAYAENETGSPTTAPLSATFSDLFCGIGAATTALSDLGLECIYANDNNPLAAETYEANHSNAENFVDRRSIVDVVRYHLDEIPRANIIAASLPTAIRGHETIPPDVQKLVDSFLRLVRHQRNEIIILEFEKKLVGTKAFPIEHLCSLLDQAGYWTEWEVYSAASFGIPHRRGHVIAVAVRKDLIPGPFRPPPAEKKPDASLELRDFLLSYDDYLKLNKDRFWLNGEGPEIINGAVVLRHKERPHKQSENSGRIVLDHRDPLQRPASSIRSTLVRAGVCDTAKTAESSRLYPRRRIYHQRGWAGSFSGRGSWEMGYYLTSGPDDGHGGVVPCVRKLHPREGARLMGLPDSFHIPENQHLAWELLGSTVTWRLLQWPLLKLAQAYPQLFEPGRPEKQPPPGWPDEYPGHVTRTYKEGVVNPSKLEFMRRFRASQNTKRRGRNPNPFSIQDFLDSLPEDK